jgi:hypothetical protein
MSEPWFHTSQVDDAIEHVIRHGAINRATLIRYTAVFEAAGLPQPRDLHAGGESDHVTMFMKVFHERCAERGLPPLDSIVVHVAGARSGQPGVGYFTVNNQRDPFRERATAAQQIQAIEFLQRQQAEVARWGTEYRREHGL